MSTFVATPPPVHLFNPIEFDHSQYTKWSDWASSFEDRVVTAGNMRYFWNMTKDTIMTCSGVGRKYYDWVEHDAVLKPISTLWELRDLIRIDNNRYDMRWLAGSPISSCWPDQHCGSIAAMARYILVRTKLEFAAHCIESNSDSLKRMLGLSGHEKLVTALRTLASNPHTVQADLNVIIDAARLSMADNLNVIKRRIAESDESILAMYNNLVQSNITEREFERAIEKSLPAPEVATPASFDFSPVQRFLARALTWTMSAYALRAMWLKIWVDKMGDVLLGGHTAGTVAGYALITSAVQVISDSVKSAYDPADMPKVRETISDYIAVKAALRNIRTNDVLGRIIDHTLIEYEEKFGAVREDVDFKATLEPNNTFCFNSSMPPYQAKISAWGLAMYGINGFYTPWPGPDSHDAHTDPVSGVVYSNYDLDWPLPIMLPPSMEMPALIGTLRKGELEPWLGKPKPCSAMMIMFQSGSAATTGSGPAAPDRRYPDQTPDWKAREQARAAAGSAVAVGAPGGDPPRAPHVPTIVEMPLIASVSPAPSAPAPPPPPVPPSRIARCLDALTRFVELHTAQAITYGGVGLGGFFAGMKYLLDYWTGSRAVDIEKIKADLELLKTGVGSTTQIVTQTMISVAAVLVALFSIRKYQGY